MKPFKTSEVYNVLLSEHGMIEIHSKRSKPLRAIHAHCDWNASGNATTPKALFPPFQQSNVGNDEYSAVFRMPYRLEGRDITTSL